MSRGPSTFRQRDLTAGLKAANAAGYIIQRVVIDRAGRIVMETQQCGQRVVEAPEKNEWDDVK
jgi:hypothetical protein